MVQVVVGVVEVPEAGVAAVVARRYRLAVGPSSVRPKTVRMPPPLWTNAFGSGGCDE